MIQVDALKKIWVGNDFSEAPKRSKNGSNFRLTWSIIFEKMKNFSFSCNKNGLVGQGMVWLLPIESPDHIEPKTYSQLCHMKLYRSLWIWIWSQLLWLQKKLFLKMMMNSEIFEILFFLSNCSTKFLMCLDQCFWLVL